MIKTLLKKFSVAGIWSATGTVIAMFFAHAPGATALATVVGVAAGFLHSLGHLVMVGWRKLRDDEKAAVAAVERELRNRASLTTRQPMPPLENTANGQPV